MAQPGGGTAGTALPACVRSVRQGAAPTSPTKLKPSRCACCPAALQRAQEVEHVLLVLLGEIVEPVDHGVRLRRPETGAARALVGLDLPPPRLAYDRPPGGGRS